MAVLRSPAPAARAMVRSWSVTLAMALTTTTGFSASRPFTMAAARAMALASCTEVPPNFMTIMKDTLAADQRSGTQIDSGCRQGFSIEVAPDLQQLSVQDG